MKTVLITGASHGIGKAAAEQFASHRCRVFLNCRKSKDELVELAEYLSKTYHCECIPLIGDVSDPEEVSAMFSDIGQYCGGTDVLINNAGISYIGLLQDMQPDEWDQIIRTNLTSVFLCSKAAIPYMLEKKCGKIINTSSVWGNAGASCEVAYSASKGGVNTFTKALAKELAPSNIQVNAIACGVIDTRMNACFNKEERICLTDSIPAGRFGTPNEVAALMYQLSEGNPYLTGQVITMDGGFS